MFKRVREKGSQCLNCGHPLHGENFCPNCGQINNTHKPTFFELIGEIFSNLFSFDTKFAHSIAVLLWRPGKMSTEFNAGKKVKYTLPIRLFLMTVILMLLSGKAFELSQVDSYYDTSTLNAESENNIIDLSDSALDSLSWELDTTEGAVERIVSYAMARPTDTTEYAFQQMELEPTFFRRMLFFKMAQLRNLNGDDFNRFVRNQTLLILLSFIPILALILRILFFRHKQYYYIDHFIFAIHSQTLLIFTMGAALLLGIFIDINIALAMGSLYVLVYQWIAIKRFYQLSWIRTTLNYLIINTTLVFVSIIFLLLVVAVSFLIY
ncbi:MAG: DUF3667 domain-containing protein [Schleiferiaceae bacterium]